jgi:WD40 repeat protein
LPAVLFTPSHRRLLTLLVVGCLLIPGLIAGAYFTWRIQSAGNNPPAPVTNPPDFELVSPGSSWVSSLCFHPNCDVFVSSGVKRNEISLWKASTGQLLDKTTCQGYALAVVFHPRGDTLLAVDSSGMLLRLSTAGLTCQTAVQVPELSSGIVQRARLSISPDGRYLAINSSGGIILWDVEEARTVRRFPGHEILTLAAVLTDERLLTVGVDKVVRTWNYRRGFLLSEHEDLPVLPGCVTLVPGCRSVVFGDMRGGSIRVAPLDDLLAGRSVELKDTANAVVPVTHSSVVLVGCGDYYEYPGRVYSCDVLTGQCRLLLSSPTPVRHMAVSSTGKWLATVNADCSLRVWDCDRFGLAEFLAEAKR